MAVVVPSRRIRSVTAALAAQLLVAPWTSSDVEDRPAAGRDTRTPEWAGVQERLVTRDPRGLRARTSGVGGGDGVRSSRAVPGWRQNAGADPRLAVANPITNSLEDRQRSIQGAYGTYLGRSERVLAGGAGREQVALGFLLSTEHLTSVVDGHYVHLLGRHIDPSGRSTWVAAIQSGTRVEAVIGGIVASEEYYGKA